MITTNKFQYLGIYKSKEPLYTLCFYKVIDVGTFSVPRLIKKQTKEGILSEGDKEVVMFYTCDADGLYISPRSWGILETDCLCQPLVYPLKEFLELYEKIKDNV